MWTFKLRCLFELHKICTPLPFAKYTPRFTFTQFKLSTPLLPNWHIQLMIVVRSCLWVSMELINVLGIHFVNWLRNYREDEPSFWMWEAHVDWKLRVKTCHLRKFDHSTAWTKWIGKNMQQPVIDMGWKKRGKELLEFDIELRMWTPDAVSTLKAHKQTWVITLRLVTHDPPHNHLPLLSCQLPSSTPPPHPPSSSFC